MRASRCIAFAVLLAACGSPTEQLRTPTSIVLSVASLDFDALGLDSVVVAEVLDAEGVRILGAELLWSTTRDEVATVTQAGLVRPRGNGSATITVSAGGGVRASIPVDVQQVAHSVTITDDSVHFVAFDQVEHLRVDVRDRTTVEIEDPLLEWSSSEPGVVSVDVNGSATAVSNGATEIVIVTDTVADTIPVSVQQDPRSVVISPSFQVLPVAAATVDLEASVLDSLDNPIAGLAVTWSSNDPGVGTVTTADPVTGTVTAQADGFAGITATHDTIEGIASLTVGDVTDWSAVGDWTTYQGDVGHTGYVPALMDVDRFSETWRVTPRTGIFFTAVAVEDGAVAFTNNSISAVRRAGALSAATGAELWSVGLGPVQTVDRPAISGGTIFVATGWSSHSNLWAFDAVTGDTLFISPYLNTDGQYLGPVPHEGKVYIAGGTESGVYRFDATTGAEEWHTPLEDFDLWTPAVRGSEVVAYLGGTSPGLTVLDRNTGAVTGHVADPGFQLFQPRIRVAPVVTAAGRIILTQEGRLLGFDPSLTTLWSQPQATIERFDGQVAVADGSIFVINTTRLEVRSEVDGSLEWAWDPPQPIGLSGTVVVTRNLVFVGDNSILYAIHRGSRRPVWTFTHHSIGPLTFGADGALYVVLEDALARIDLR